MFCQHFSLFLVPLLAASSLKAQDVPDEAPTGNGQLETAPAFIPGGVDEEGRNFSYLAQPSKNKKIILTASNGFFTKGTCKAAGESKLPKIGDEELIVPNFGWLEDWKDTEGSIKWYLHISKPGPVRFHTYLEVSGSDNSSKIRFRLGDQTRTVTTGNSDGSKPQNWDVVFDVKEAGEYLLSIQADEITSPAEGVGKLHRIDAFGPALESAHLLRARWRPAAVHGGYSSSKTNDAKLLVMTTRSVVPISNYSPVTTPFGYYGTSFTEEKRSNGEFNFSMWGKEDAAADLKQMPHLLGLGSPEGEFSGFGHEGSGVKPRGWTPMPDGPELCVQALRVEPGDLYDTYYGYYYDHPSNAWKFYCAGNKWHGGKSKDELKVGSFCEVPGPPQVERTGDIYREVRRRGWYYDEENWIPMDVFNIGGAGSKGDLPVNKRWYTTGDGEFAMGCGGIRFYLAEVPEPPSTGTELPYFLQSETILEIFTMPVEYGSIAVSELSPDSATIDITVTKGDGLQNGAVYFGTSDALTFAPRELHGTEKKSTLSQTVNESSWEMVSKVEAPTTGSNQVTLENLEPETTYYFRPLFSNQVSRVWSNETHSFTTPESGSGPVSMKPAAPNLDAEPMRTWTYTIGGSERQLEGRLVGIAGSKIEIERKADGKQGVLDLQILSEADQTYISSRKN